MQKMFQTDPVMGSVEDALERCRGKLEEVGLTGRNLESIEAETITRQLVDKLGLAYFDEIEQVVLSQKQAARDLGRASGSLRRSICASQRDHGRVLPLLQAKNFLSTWPCGCHGNRCQLSSNSV